MSRDVLDAFAEALRRRGLIPPADLVADGRIHRCDADRRGGRGDGAYALHLDGVPAGGYQNWRDGLGWEDWRGDGDGRRLSPDEARRERARIEALRRERDADAARRHVEAAERAGRIWAEATDADDSHPYLALKGVRAHGLRVAADGRLVIPLRDAEGALHSLQFIADDGAKRYLTGGRVRGCWHLLGFGDVVTSFTS